MGYLNGDEGDKISSLDQPPAWDHSIVFNVIGIIGNAFVLFVFLQRYTESTNYRIFVVYMASKDLGT